MPAQGLEDHTLVSQDEEAGRYSSVTVSLVEHVIDPPPAHTVIGQHTDGWPRIDSSNLSWVQLPNRKRAVLIGISYFGTRGQLPCSNVGGLAQLLNQNYGYHKENMVVLTDTHQRPTSQPTKKQILQSMHWLVRDSRPGDHLLFYYSGHGDSEKTLVPLDFRENGFIQMTGLQAAMITQQIPGVLMTVIIDWYGNWSSAQDWFDMELPTL